MSATIKAVFEKHCGHLKFDKTLAKKIHSFQVSFVNRNEEHMSFFGGNLTGVQIVRWLSSDKDSWFTDIMEVDELALEEDLHSLAAINTEFLVSSNVFNNACMWMIHKFMTSPYLSDKDKHQAMIDTALVLYFRFLTSLLYKYFPYPADPAVAAATYAQLSNKFEIKQHGSWFALLVSRCEKLIDPNGLHRKTLMNYDDDLAIVYLLNDSQGRIRDIMKNIVSEFIKVHKLGTKIKTTSSLAEYEGEEVLKDATKNLSNYTRYLHSIVGDKRSFIKEELITIICNVVTTCPPNMLRTSLEWMSVNHRHAGVKVVEELIDVTLVHSFANLADNRTTMKSTNDLPGMIVKLRGLYMSSRSVDTDLLQMRDKARQVVKSATNSKNESLLASIRTGVLLYITLRAFTMHHYASKG